MTELETERLKLRQWGHSDYELFATMNADPKTSWSITQDTAPQTEGIAKVEESLKWREPRYLTKRESTIKMNWGKIKIRQLLSIFPS